jgi:hypothetical protein
MAINDVWMLTVKGTVSETMHIHTLHFRTNLADGTGVALTTLYGGAPLTAYRNLFQTLDKPVQEIKAEKVCGSLPLPAPSIISPISADQLGTRSASGGGPMPAYVAALVSERGSVAGRRYSGRFFIGGLDENDVAGNNLTAGYISVLTAYCSALGAAFVAPVLPDWRLFAFSNLLADGDPLHTKKNPNPPPERIADPVASVDCDLAGSDVSSLVVSTRPTTMRSRKYGHGL